MVSGTSSVGNPCNFSEGGMSDFFIETFGSSLWLWFALGGATVEVVRAVQGASTAEVLRAVRGSVASASTAEVLRAVRGSVGSASTAEVVRAVRGALKVVRGRGTAAVRATRLLLYRRGKSRRVLHAFRNNVEVLLRLWCSSHLFYLLVGRPTHGLPAVRQRHLQDPRRRRGAVEHELPEVSGRLDADRVVAGESARRGEDVLRQARALLNGFRR